MSDKRLVAALGKMTSDNENERVIGMNAVALLLKKRNLTWVDLAEKITGRTVAEMTAPSGSRKRPKPTAEPPPPPRPQPASPPPRRGGTRRHLSGADIPVRIRGKIRISNSSSDGLVVEMVGVDSWGPMRATNPTIMGHIRRASSTRDPRDVTVITTPGNEVEPPHIIDVRIHYAGTE